MLLALQALHVLSKETIFAFISASGLFLWLFSPVELVCKYLLYHSCLANSHQLLSVETQLRITLSLTRISMNDLKMGTSTWGSEGIDSLLEPASSGHSRNCSFLALLYLLHFSAWRLQLSQRSGFHLFCRNLAHSGCGEHLTKNTARLRQYPKYPLEES